MIFLIVSVTSTSACTESALTDLVDYEWYDGQSEPYSIRTSADLKGLSNIMNGIDGRTAYDFAGCVIEIETDIDLKGYNWLPIGLASYSYYADDVVDGDLFFSESFNGKGHTISNMTVNVANTGLEDYSAGLFGTVDCGSGI